ncbi:hypothetical protein [Mammaliicoccus sciuri]|uniref:hypothetical protein n=1 Tax=Mammaliicoccus sciuri TaxID=1296 RepID=UPI002883A35E|nr:hypothetical protein [Mammaliicoccus sciuri]MDT0753990.1 hypothetical protein [Mammaliicoccus sciuri]
MPTIKYTREDITRLENERDQYKTAHNKLTAGLKEAVEESIKYKRERDSLIKDLKKLRELKDQLIFENRYHEEQVKSLRNKYTNLTEHIRDKAKNNPSEHRYFRLVHFIDDLEGDNHEG